MSSSLYLGYIGMITVGTVMDEGMLDRDWVARDSIGSLSPSKDEQASAEQESERA